MAVVGIVRDQPGKTEKRRAIKTFGCRQSAVRLPPRQNPLSKVIATAVGAIRVGRSRSGFSTKIHLKTDLDGIPLAFVLTGGERSDSKEVATLLDVGPDLEPRAVVADKGYNAKANSALARSRGIAPVIPFKSNAKTKPTFFARRLYRARARIEQTFGNLNASNASHSAARKPHRIMQASSHWPAVSSS